MGRAYSPDLRERVIAAVDSGAGAYAAASIFRVSASYIYKVLRRWKKTGETSGHARLQNDDPGSDPDPHVKVDHIGIHHP